MLGGCGKVQAANGAVHSARNSTLYAPQLFVIPTPASEERIRSSRARSVVMQFGLLHQES